ncbi:hypothetical protein HMPREF3086_03775 [Dietzia sp. HMSC21D01]|uniref:Secreted protein n=1 Tax=Dietzia cinnamea TaxID=321318 RepID=A0AAW5Q554_9ACTN|nr:MULTISPECIES: hypothetical protein [Dietzia]MCT1864151.1 hypothetical protein [Dietzia cinnamea]MCT2028818.1 hypothetical protein [Dietzia cinnamea]MCT2032346.1 hypothetical protein [Dietzia cinnamea]MCT2074932.1 hypothetical protein [Dietzia cinnamea]MCT2106728.1 hypothetical protein [Dietzia cinnamea]
MKKTIAVIGSAAALSFAGAGLASAQSAVPGVDAGSLGAGETVETPGEDVETPAEVSAIAEQICGTIDAYDFLGSAEGVVPGLSGEDCAANAQLAVDAAFSGDIQGAIDILRGIEAEVSDEDDAEDDVDTEEPVEGENVAPEGDDEPVTTAVA